jgi:hypothetical protein
MRSQIVKKYSLGERMDKTSVQTVPMLEKFRLFTFFIF